MKYFSTQTELPVEVYPVDLHLLPQNSLTVEVVGICMTLCTTLLVRQIRLLVEACKR